MLTRRGNWNDVWANPIILSLSKDQRRKAKTGEAANEGAAEVEAGEFRGGNSGDTILNPKPSLLRRRGPS